MEFVDGFEISDYVMQNPDHLDDIFVQTIRGFRHLEENNILHRDIRPANIMVSHDGIVKIIDFGFGKKVILEGDFEKSISLNWRYSVPLDFNEGTYNFCTEIYFVGKLFEEILRELEIQDFSYGHILDQMIQTSPRNRINSFFELDRLILKDQSGGVDFSTEEKKIYKNFVSDLQKVFSQIETGSQYVKDIEQIIKSLEDVYRNSLLEDFVQNPQTVARCFVKGPYYFSKSVEVSVYDLRLFIQLLKELSVDKQKIVINNLWQRLDKIQRYTIPPDDDLPF